MEMEKEFIKAIVKFAIVIGIVLAVVMIVLGTAILFFPQMFLKILLYVVGVALIIAGFAIIISFLCGILRRKDS